MLLPRASELLALRDKDGQEARQTGRYYMVRMDRRLEKNVLFDYLNINPIKQGLHYIFCIGNNKNKKILEITEKQCFKVFSAYYKLSET